MNDMEMGTTNFPKIICDNNKNDVNFDPSTTSLIFMDSKIR